jgi:hypothetical protein
VVNADTPIAIAPGTSGSNPAQRLLPPPGGDKVMIAEFANMLLLESTWDQRRQAWELEAAQAMNQYLGYHWGDLADDGTIRLTLNRTQNCVISLMAIQAGDPPKITFTARESGETPQLFLNTQNPAGQVLAGQIAGQAQAGGHDFDPMTPLADDVAAVVRQEVAQGQMLADQLTAAGQPVPPNLPTRAAVIEISEFESAQALQTVFDAMWEECSGQFTFVENVLNKNILGMQPTLYEFDDESKRHVLKNIHGFQFFPDSMQSNYDYTQYEIYDEPITADEACVLYPQFADKIREEASTGALRFPGSRPYNPGYRYTMPFQRDMIVVRHLWLRNQPYPITPEEAIAAGKLVAGQVPTGVSVDVPHPDDPNQVLHQPEMRDAYFHPATGQEVTPTLSDPAQPNPHWPVRHGIRQIKIILQETVDDRECEFADLPIVWNVNLPIPFCPYGQGEPMRLKGLQDALNHVLSSLVTYSHYNAVPPEVISSEVVKLMDSQLKKARTKWNQRVVIPQSLLDRLGGDISKILQTLEVPAMPADFWKLLNFLVEMIDKEGNQADVTQGNASSSWSGDAIAALQNAASQIVRAKSMMTEFWLKRIVKLMAHSILTRMTPADWGKYCRKYPPQALAALHAQAAASIDLSSAISVQIKSGSGASKQQQATNLLNAAASGKAPVSPQTILETLELDPEVESQQTTEWNRKQQMGQMGGMPPGAPAPQPATPAPAAAPIA